MSTTPTADRPVSIDLRATMMADHAEIATIFDDVVLAFRSGHRDEATAMFRVFERRLDDHLTAEDERLRERIAVTAARAYAVPLRYTGSLDGNAMPRRTPCHHR